MEEKTSKSTRRIFMVLLLIAFIVIAAVLKLTKSFAIPITVSVLLAFVLYPLCLKLNRLHIPWVLCIIIMLVLGTFLFILVSTVLVSSISSVVKVYPSYEYKFNALSEKITQIYKQFCETMNIEYDEQTSIWRTLSNSLNINLKSALLNVYSVGTSVLSVLKTILILVLFLVFLLIELNPKNSSSKIDAAFLNTGTRNKVKSVIANTIHDVTHFLSIKFLISLITGCGVWLLSILVGLEFPVIWGILAFILNFIPTLGSIISWAITTVFAIVQFAPSWGPIIFIAVVVLAINMVLGNIVEPRWEGQDLGLSPFVILVSLSFWGWMWGFAGMVLAVPLMVILKICFENSAYLRPIAILLGSGKKGKKNPPEIPAASSNPESGTNSEGTEEKK